MNHITPEVREYLITLLEKEIASLKVGIEFCGRQVELLDGHQNQHIYSKRITDYSTRLTTATTALQFLTSKKEGE